MVQALRQHQELRTYVIVLASLELDQDEPYPVPKNTEILKMPYPHGVDRAFLEQDLKGWIEAGYRLQEFQEIGEETGQVEFF